MWRDTVMFLGFMSLHILRGQKWSLLSYHARHFQQIHWSKLLCGMYGFTAKSSVATFNYNIDKILELHIEEEFGIDWQKFIWSLFCIRFFFTFSLNRQNFSKLSFKPNFPVCSLASRAHCCKLLLTNLWLGLMQLSKREFLAKGQGWSLYPFIFRS